MLGFSDRRAEVMTYLTMFSIFVQFHSWMCCGVFIQVARSARRTYSYSNPDRRVFPVPRTGHMFTPSSCLAWHGIRFFGQFSAFVPLLYWGLPRLFIQGAPNAQPHTFVFKPGPAGISVAQDGAYDYAYIRLASARCGYFCSFQQWWSASHVFVGLLFLYAVVPYQVCVRWRQSPW